MTRFFTLLVLAVAGFTVFTAELSSSNGSPGGRTGSPGDGGATCTQCHGGSANPQTGWISTNIPVTGYVPGQTYTITASGTHTGVSRFGFEVTAERAGGIKTGGFSITDAVQTKLTNNSNAVTHTASGFSPSGSSKSWSFNWIAPASGSGMVTFYGAFNAANGNGGTSGDVIYTSTLAVNESVSTGIFAAENAAPSVFPNPASDYVKIRWNKRATEVVLKDLSGRTHAVASLIDGEGTMNVSQLNPGLYLLSSMDGKSNVERLIVR